MAFVELQEASTSEILFHPCLLPAGEDQGEGEALCLRRTPDSS